MKANYKVKIARRVEKVVLTLLSIPSTVKRFKCYVFLHYSQGRSILGYAYRMDGGKKRDVVTAESPLPIKSHQIRKFLIKLVK